MPNDKEFELDDLESFSFDDLSLDDTPPAADADPGEDPFGVWVKSAPEDVAPDEAVTDSPAPGSDALPEEDFLSTEELANLDDSFDFVTVSEEPLEGETPLEDEIAFLDTPEAVEAERASVVAAPASFDEVSLDDFVSFDDVALEDSPGLVPDLPVSGTEVPGADEDLNEEFLDIDIDIEDDIGDEELEIIEGATPRAPEPEEVSLDTFSAQDVDLSEFGDFEEVSPVAEGPLSEGEDLPEVVDVPEMAEVPAFDADLEAFALSEAPVEEDFFEETILDEVPTEAATEDPLPVLIDEGEVTLDLEPDDQTDLDHIMALEEDLTSGIRTPGEPEAAGPAPAAPSSDLAALILGKIEQELSSIKQEITELKKEVTHLRVPLAMPAAPSVPETAPVVEPEPAAEAEPKPHGFFDEEDDETIALTGDELDNILSTAEISEGEEPGVSLDEDLLGLDEEGNLIDVPVPEPEAVQEDLHVTDEEFLAGTALDLNEPDPLADEALAEDAVGIPDSIELEESLPPSLADDETEDLLTDSPFESEVEAETAPEAEPEFEVSPLPEGLLEGTPEPLEIPFDDDIGLELDDVVPLAPDLRDEGPVPEAPQEEPDDIGLPALESDSEGWSLPAGPAEETVDEIELSLDEPAPAFEAPLPPPPAPPAPMAPAAAGSLSPGLKEELKAVLQYMDKLLASLPDDKIQEFAESEHFEVYKRLFEELGLIE